MPRSKDPSTYPPMFYDLIEAAYEAPEEMPLVFPLSSEKKADSIHAHINSYRRAIKTEYDKGRGQYEDLLHKCQAITISKRGSHLYLYNLYKSADYIKIASIIKQPLEEPMVLPPLPPQEPPAAPEFLSTLTKETPRLDTDNYYSRILAEAKEAEPSAPAEPVRPIRKHTDKDIGG